MNRLRQSAATVILAGLAVGACSNGPTAVTSPSPHRSPSASTSPAATPAASSQPPSSSGLPPLAGDYGVLVTPIPGSTTYNVTIVGTDGKVAASAQATSPPTPTCGGTAAALVPLPVSTSERAVYYMDAGGTIRYLTPSGKTGLAGNVFAPTSTRRSMFAVSPDDQELAVVVVDFSSGGATTQLHILDFGVQDRPVIFTQTGAYTLWPVGWHGTNNLVLGKIAACTQGGGPFVGTPQELHVVDPATADRRFTIGSANCPPVNRPSPAGVICESPPNATVLSWTDTTIRTLPIQGPVGAFLSPSGANIAFVDNTGTSFTNGGSAMAGVFTCAWIDETHVLAGGDVQNQARIGNVTTGAIVAVPAQGDCGGRLPGTL